MKNIFDSTKIKLTLRYLAIIMFITLGFSCFIFAAINQATQIVLEGQEQEMQKQLSQVPPQFRQYVVFDTHKTEAILDIRQRVLANLIVVNIVVLLASATLGYYLAGKTLQPIEEMVTKQKRFISDAAHELKTPLTAIKTDLEVTLRDKNLTLEDAKETLNRMLEETDELSAMTASLLSVSKYDMVNVNHKNIATFKLNDLVYKVVKKFAASAKEKNIEIIQTLSEVEIKADEKEIEQVLNNIIDNAIKYSNSDSKIYINLSGVKGKAELRVKDEGVGISAENLSHVFDPFFREDKSRAKSKTEGYGLGLAITKEIIESYGGSISVTSKPGNGSEFKVLLPN
jgi:two-component system sensor histidine kinase CiaH